MKNLELQNFGVVEMDNNEKKETDGGAWWLLPTAVVAAIVISAVNNFGDIREGIVDGYKGKPRH